MKKYLGVMLCCSIPYGLPQTAAAHSTIINNQAWQVCEARERSDACEYTDNHENIYRGTCQLMSEKLLCVRNQPIVEGGKNAAGH